ncbi:hypothetical protein RLDS_07380 [Sphingobium lactosutens DS20]|uniref:Uncharacterized protein n=1 Tax=Sphingobium lactosutens DS20 TaxID=1331060 RepID=T0J3S1_9SPHN|nr:hypothetical protein RLDS_07380 [Sphingobium lactosutens DS20]
MSDRNRVGDDLIRIAGSKLQRGANSYWRIAAPRYYH